MVPQRRSIPWTRTDDCTNCRKLAAQCRHLRPSLISRFGFPCCRTDNVALRLRRSSSATKSSIFRFRKIRTAFAKILRRRPSLEVIFEHVAPSFRSNFKNTPRFSQCCHVRGRVRERDFRIRSTLISLLKKISGRRNRPRKWRHAAWVMHKYNR